MLAKLVKAVGAWGLVVLATLFGVFAAGYAFQDPGGWLAVGLVAAYVVPAVGLGLVAWRWPERAMVTVVPVVVLVALPLFSDTVRGWFDEVGPVLALATGVAAVVLAILGLHRPGLAGTLLIAVAAFIFVQLVIEANAVVEEPSPLGVLGTSGGVILLPMVVSGVLLLIAYELERHAHRPAPTSRVRPAAA
ncbi:MAG: hypothetical protein H5T83_04100 [Actinotalea sp.]|nr:hypothetical protein [Actinotalea sp.]